MLWTWSTGFCEKLEYGAGGISRSFNSRGFFSTTIWESKAWFLVGLIGRYDQGGRINVGIIGSDW